MKTGFFADMQMSITYSDIGSTYLNIVKINSECHTQQQLVSNTMLRSQFLTKIQKAFKRVCFCYKKFTHKNQQYVECV